MQVRHIVTAPAVRPRPADGWLALVAFLAPAMLWMEVQVLGRLFVSELVLLGLLPFLYLARGRMLAAPLPRTLLALGVLWLASQMLTDTVRETEFRDYARGWARISFFLANFCVLYMLLYGSRQRIVLFGLGIAVGGYLTFWLNSSEYADSLPWKFGVGYATTMLAVLVTQWRAYPANLILRALPLLSVGVVHLTLGFRSMMGVLILSLVYMAAQWMVGRRRVVPAPSPLRGLLFLVVCAVIGVGTIQFYEIAAESGYLDERSTLTYERQNVGEFGILLGGRSEILASSRAVMDSPILGHGSWASNPDYAAYLLDARVLGYDTPLSIGLEKELIPSHSHLMGAWVEAGILGAVFWAWVAFLCLRVIARAYLIRDRMVILIAFIAFSLLWDIAFSPFGGSQRLLGAWYVVLMMFAFDMLRGRFAGRQAVAPARPRRQRVAAAPLGTSPR